VGFPRGSSNLPDDVTTKCVKYLKIIYHIHMEKSPWPSG
jgi:hypothetical protein